MNYSVVIPSYNHEKYITEAILSIVHQTFQPSEIIIIDDGSTDTSLEICQNLAQQFPLIRVIAQTNQGAHNAINAGLKLTTSEYVAILNSDDVFQPNRFEILFNDSSSEWDLIGSDIQLIDNESQDLGISHWLTRAKWMQKLLGNNIFSLAYANYFMTTSNFLFKRSLLAEIGYFNDYRYCHDLDFLLRVSKNKKLKFTDQKLLKYRFHSTNTVKEGVNKVLNETWLVIFKNSGSTHFPKLIRIPLLLIALLNGQFKFYNLNRSKRHC